MVQASRALRDSTQDSRVDDPQRLITTLQRNWSLEMDGVDMYGTLAEREKIPERKIIFQKLSDLERKHAQQWAKRLKELGGAVPTSHSGKGHAVRIADTPGGMQEILKAIEQEERRDVAGYSGGADGTPRFSGNRPP